LLESKVETLRRRRGATLF